MPKSLTSLTVFLASPGDLPEERKIVDKVIGQLNRSIARGFGVYLDLVRWENLVPGMGRPEQVIIDQAGIEESDLFVGILWNRFGTPTGKADSGTEEEFERAFQRWAATGKPRILLYFCVTPANLDAERQLQQKMKLVSFKSRVSKIGLTRSFDSAKEFEDALRQDVSNYLLSLVRVPTIHSTSAVGSADVAMAVGAGPAPSPAGGSGYAAAGAAAAAASVEPAIKVVFGLETMDQLRRVLYGLEKDTHSAWTIHFQLQERSAPAEELAGVTALSVPVNDDLAPAAKSAALSGLTASQAAYALGPAAESVRGTATGDVDPDDARQTIIDTLNQ